MSFYPWWCRIGNETVYRPWLWEIYSRHGRLRFDPLFGHQAPPTESRWSFIGDWSWSSWMLQAQIDPWSRRQHDSILSKRLLLPALSLPGCLQDPHRPPVASPSVAQCEGCLLMEIRDGWGSSSLTLSNTEWKRMIVMCFFMPLTITSLQPCWQVARPSPDQASGSSRSRIRMFLQWKIAAVHQGLILLKNHWIITNGNRQTI